MPKIVDHDERRTMLADAVLAVVAREGLAAVTMRAVGAESGWSLGVLNHYFASRHELLLAALRRAGDLQAARYDEIRADGANCLEQLHAITASILPLDERRVALTRIFLFFYAEAAADKTAREEIAGFLARWRGVVRQTMVAGRESGHISPGVAVDAATIALVALTDGLSFEALLDPVVMTAIRAADFPARLVGTALSAANLLDQST